ncbi:MAG: hypothetical protein JJE17_12075 [Peptostreptococcaceae bacterium]|nr:hypothetical protein [Peptostreptococcaceae bacterium]
MFSVIKLIFKAFVILTIYNVCFLGLTLFVFLHLMPFSGASKSDLFIANAKPIGIGVNVVLMGAILVSFYRKKKGKNVKEKDNPELNKKSNIQKNENTIVFQTDKGELKLTNPFRGILSLVGQVRARVKA